MTLRLILSLLLPVATGWIVMRALWSPPPKPDWRHLVIRAALAIGLGLGLASCGFFAALVLWGPSRTAAVTADALLLLGALGLQRLRFGRAPARTNARSVTSRPAPASLWLLRASGGLAILSGGGALWLFAGLQPHGDWDAWAIWNLRARFLFRGGAEWRDGFSPLLAWSHPDYPLLLPGLVARTWLYAGRETVWGPMALALLFTGATLALILAAMAELRTESQGWLAALVLISTPAFTRLGTTQFADVPLAFFYLAALVAFGLGDSSADDRPGLAGVAGAGLGLAAWTKNEGVVFVLAVLLARSATVGRQSGWSRYLRHELGPAALGLLPVLLVIGYFKLRVATPSEYVSLHGLVEKIGDAGRYVEIARAVIREVGGWGGWPVSVVGLLAAYAVAMGWGVPHAARRTASASALAVAFTAAAYAGAYVLSPYPLGWHLATSLGRLGVQLWPASLFAYFLIVHPPEVAGRRLAAGQGPEPEDGAAQPSRGRRPTP